MRSALSAFAVEANAPLATMTTSATDPASRRDGCAATARAVAAALPQMRLIMSLSFPVPRSESQPSNSVLTARLLRRVRNREHAAVTARRLALGADHPSPPVSAGPRPKVLIAYKGAHMSIFGETA